MKILWLHSHLSYWGGGTKFIYYVINELTKKHTVDLYVQKSSSNITKKFEQIPMKVTTLSKSSTGDIRFWFNFKKQIQKEINLLKDLKKNYDIIISSMFPMNIIANSVRLPHIQYIFEPFAFFWDPLMINELSFTKKHFLKFFKNKFSSQDLDATRKSTRILTVNSDTKKWISKIYDRDSIPTLLGVDTSFFKKTFDKELIEKYGNKKIIIHSTDWTPLKRTSWLIDQLAKINSKDKNVILLITEVKQQGTEKDQTLKKIQDHNLKNVIICGFIPQEKLPSYYSLANFAVYCGVGQGASAASLFVLECMACETPVIRTNDTLEEVEHQKSGFLFTSNNKNEFQQYVVKLLEDENLQSTFGKNARDSIIERYSWEKVAKIFEKNCLEILNL